MKFFRRPENPGIGDKAFRNFAEDVFRRRLIVAGFDRARSSETPLVDVFGKTPTAEERARQISMTPPKIKRSIPSEWAQEWKDLFMELRSNNPLEAKLGEAWLRQKQQKTSQIWLDKNAAKKMPWTPRKWWKKERNEVALMQLASEAGQTMAWFGERHIIDLSGWNILAFMSICRTIWSGWIRGQSDENLEGTRMPEIDNAEQIVGIYEASKMWVDKLREGHDGDRRREFILRLGEWFVSQLKADKALSNPGHNGFSLLRSEFEKTDELLNVIRKCRDYGDLIESTHTPKNQSGARLKWYLNPILCPYFGLPHVRTKEPIYTRLAELKSKTSSHPKFSSVPEDSATLDLFEQS